MNRKHDKTERVQLRIGNLAKIYFDCVCNRACMSYSNYFELLLFRTPNFDIIDEIEKELNMSIKDYTEILKVQKSMNIKRHIKKIQSAKAMHLNHCLSTIYKLITNMGNYKNMKVVCDTMYDIALLYNIREECECINEFCMEDYHYLRDRHFKHMDIKPKTNFQEIYDMRFVEICDLKRVYEVLQPKSNKDPSYFKVL